MIRNRQRGYTLVELMVGLFVGFLVSLAITAIVFYASLHRHDLERVSRQVENGRYAMQLLADDLANAGYFGEFDPREMALPTTLPDPCSTDVADIKSAVGVHVQTYTAAAAKPPCIADVRAGTPVIAIRRASTCIAGTTGCDPVTAGEVYMQASLCQSELDAALVAAHYEVAAQVASGASPFSLTQRDCITAAVLRNYVVHIYFVANNNTTGDGVPTLKRAELAGGAFSVMPLVDGVESIQFEYALDTNDDSTPDAVMADPTTFGGCAADACAVANWANVVAVTVHLLARTNDTSLGYTDTKTYAMGLQPDGTQLVLGPFNDGYKRHVYLSAVRFNSPAGRRE